MYIQAHTYVQYTCTFRYVICRTTMGDLLISPLYMLLTCISIYLNSECANMVDYFEETKRLHFFGGLGYENSFYFDTECSKYTCTN